MDIDHIRTMIENGDYEVTQHAIDRMHQRGVTLDQILNVLKTGRIHSERHKEKPLPKCLVAGYVDRRVGDLIIPGVPIYVACAVGKKVHIITVEWEPR